MAELNRYVIGPNAEGRSAVLEKDVSNVQSEEGFFWRATLWSTKESPVDNSIEGDRALAEDLGARRSPFPNGMLVRALELWPDQDPNMHRKQFSDLNKKVGQTHQPTEEDSQRHPTMHRTDTLDCISVVRGEIYMLTDVEEILLRQGDTVIIRGTNHGWSNRSDEPCLLIGSMLDAVPAE